MLPPAAQADPGLWALAGAVDLCSRAAVGLINIVRTVFPRVVQISESVVCEVRSTSPSPPLDPLVPLTDEPPTPTTPKLRFTPPAAQHPISNRREVELR